MNHKDKKLVIFDFDGVLANTIEFSYKLHKDINKGLTWEKFSSFSYGNFHEGMGKAVKEEGHKIPENFREEYEKKLLTLSTEDILHDTVLKLADKYKLSVVSSTTSEYVKKFLQQENLLECFSDILGADIHTSKVIKTNSLLEKYHLNGSDAVYITDTLGDIKEARECGVVSIAVLWGHHTKETLSKGNPVTIVENPQDLIGAIENVLK
jgi:phosphoglycolate phosphatase